MNNLNNVIRKFEENIFKFLDKMKALLFTLVITFINKICECILNIIEGRVKISNKDFEKLKPYKNLFRKLIKKNTKLKEKKKLIIQKGGFLQILIPAIISGLASIISSVISKPDSE